MKYFYRIVLFLPMFLIVFSGIVLMMIGVNIEDLENGKVGDLLEWSGGKMGLE